MSKRRFPSNFFKNLRNDPILSEEVDVLEAPPGAADEGARLQAIAEVFAPSYSENSQAVMAKDEIDVPIFEFEEEDYVTSSIFAPPELRGEADTRQQLFFINEREDALKGLQEVNALLRKGWRVSNAFASQTGQGYKALVLLEQQL